MNDSDNIYPVNLTIEHDIKDNGNSIMKSRDDGSVLIDGENAIKISININSSNFPRTILYQSLRKAFDSILSKYY